jgi:hypothetical protein
MSTQKWLFFRHAAFSAGYTAAAVLKERRTGAALLDKKIPLL